MTDVRGARSVRMIQDPRLSGDVLLVGLVLAARIDFGLQVKGVKELALMAFPDGNNRAKFWRAKKAFSDDIRRYRPPGGGFDTPCGAPMIRREGTCGKRVSSIGSLTDWTTGEMKTIAACSRHRDWWWTALQTNRQAKPDEVPLPVANSGGVLREHFPEINWPKFWKALDPTWVEHPEVKPWPKPTLTLVLGGAS